jgi:hypothetical protein
MATYTLAAASGRAALLSGLAPLLLLAGVLLLVLAAPASKDRLDELRDRFRGLVGTLPDPVRTRLGAAGDAGTDEATADTVGWRTSDPEQFSEFYKLIDDDADIDDAR